VTDNYDKILYWIDLAEYDLKTAKSMLKTKRFLYVGFMCHQVIEKMFKALYVNKYKEVAPYTHNIARLAEKPGVYKSLTEEQKDFLDLLGPLNIESRYPKNKDKLIDQLDYDQCYNLIEQSEEMLLWIKKKL